MKKTLILILLFFISITVFSQKKYPDYVEASQINNSDLFLIWQGSQNKKITFSKLSTAIPYVQDSGMIKNDIRYLKQLTDTTAEWIVRNIYVSMPNDPQTPGSDTEGDGSISKPFSTIEKAIRSIKPIIYTSILIYLDSGTFDLSAKTAKIFYEKQTKNTESSISLIGSYKELATVALTSATVPYYKLNNYTVQSGTSTFNLNTSINLGTSNYKGKILAPVPTTAGLLTGSAIWKNTATTITAATSGTIATRIVEPITTLNLEVTSFKDVGCNLRIYNFILNYPSSTTTCYMSSKNDLSFLIVNNCIMNLTQITANSKLRLQNYCTVNGCYIKGNTIANGTNIVSVYSEKSSISRCVIENTNSAKLGTGINLYADSRSGSIATNYLKGFEIGLQVQRGYKYYCDYGMYVDSCSYAFGLQENTEIINYPSNIVPARRFFVKDCDKFISIATGDANYKFSVAALTTDNTEKLLVTNNEFTNPTGNKNISFPYSFPEYQQRVVSTIANNSTDSISIANLSYNRSINIDYTITRNGQYRRGSMIVLNTGSAYILDQGDFIESADVGLTFNGVYRSGTSNTLKLKWTSTNTGYAGSIQIDYRRQNF